MILSIYEDDWSMNTPKYCITLSDESFMYDTTKDIIDFLEISKEEYRRINLQNNAIPTVNRYLFSMEEDAKECFKELEPYYIMKKLIE